MKAIVYREFRGPIEVAELPDPEPTRDGVVVRVEACGLCRSDWHGWMGHDGDVRVPQVPGHELAGVIVAVGSEVRRWREGQRVTVPFCLGCGTCAECRSGHPQVCPRYEQPGFTLPGAFAELVALPLADFNLVHLPDTVDAVSAASLGCRFGTAFRAVVDQGRVARGEWVAVFGCGGVGLAAIMIAREAGARIVAVDVDAAALALAASLGADVAIEVGPIGEADVPAAVRDATGGGAHLSLDALGSRATCLGSIRSLRKRGRHVQIGVMAEGDARPEIPMGEVMFSELEIIGSHGIQAERYGAILKRMAAGRLDPARLVTRSITLDEVPEALARFVDGGQAGVTVMVR
jgi:alcohol dehydrogenase